MLYKLVGFNGPMFGFVGGKVNAIWICCLGSVVIHGLLAWQVLAAKLPAAKHGLQPFKILTSSPQLSSPQLSSLHTPPPSSLPVHVTLLVNHAAARSLAANPTAQFRQKTIPSLYYFKTHEVDQLAYPSDEWVIDQRLPSSLGAVQLHIAIMVSASGHIDRWQLLHSNQPAHINQALLAPLGSTPLIPAKRQGQAVPSVREIQLTLSSVDNN